MKHIYTIKTDLHRLDEKGSVDYNQIIRTIKVTSLTITYRAP